MLGIDWLKAGTLAVSYELPGLLAQEMGLECGLEGFYRGEEQVSVW